MPASWTEIYRTHFQHTFAKPFDIQVYYDADNFALKLATHDLAMRGFRTYASLGLADLLVRREEEDFGEVILYSDVPDQEVPAMFVHALFFILRNEIPLGSRFAIGGIQEMQPEFTLRYHKTALYFTLAENDGNERFNLVRRGDDFGRVYQAYFISREEDRYLDDNGPDAFEEKLLKPFVRKTSAEHPIDDAGLAQQDVLADLEASRPRRMHTLSIRRPSCV